MKFEGKTRISADKIQKVHINNVSGMKNIIYDLYKEEWIKFRNYTKRNEFTDPLLMSKVYWYCDCPNPTEHHNICEELKLIADQLESKRFL